MRSFEIADSAVKITSGQNAQDNYDLIDMSVERLNEYPDIQMYWFHLEKFPSCHVILEIPSGNTLDVKFITMAAQHTKNNSKYKNSHGIYVSYTPLTNIKKTGTVGEVEFKSSRKVKRIMV